MSSPRIQLTETESALCTLLDDCSKWIHSEQPEQPFVECRIAGGWVRDKLLGLQSNDIDVALSSMMGVPYAEHLVRFMSTKGETIREPAKVAQNPEQSKHLETAMVKVLGIDIDLVNLRSEVYAEGSRIPTEVTFGTPLQDALRRDITINSLFYNVHTRAVEDFTGKGLDDLRAGVIRTPLAPRETFMDDPLRVLRCVRFASRYGYRIEDEISHAIKQPDIQIAVRTKISRERVGVELDKMLKAKDPLLSLEMIESLSLHESVFFLPGSLSANLSGSPTSCTRGLAAATILATLLQQSKTSDPSNRTSAYSVTLPPLHPTLLTHSTNPEVKPRLYLAAALTPFRGLTIPEKKRLAPATEVVIREGLKLGTQNHYLDGVSALFEASERLSRPTLDRFEPSSSSHSEPELELRPTTQRAALGLALREKCVHNSVTGSHWSSSLLFSLVQDLMGTWDDEAQKLDGSEAAKLVEIYNAFVTKLEELDLPAAIDAAPLLNGHEVCTALSIKPGPQMSSIIARLVEWQLSHPGESKDACVTFLKDEQAAGRLIVISMSNATEGKRKAGQEGKGNKKAKKTS